MINFKKIIVLMGILSLSAFVFILNANADETVPGTFTTTGELATPEITVLGLYNQNGSLVPTDGYVTPNTKHSIRFEVSNPTYAFEDMLITVAFFSGFEGSRSEFDQVRNIDRTDIDGSAFVARFGYQDGARVPLEIVYNNSYTADDVSWDDNFFDSGDDKIEFLETDKSYEFEVYFNMSKVADVTNTYYIGAFASQGITGQEERFATFQSEGPYYTNDYVEFEFTSSSLTWELEEGETFLDYDGSSDSATETIDSTNFFFIANTYFVLDVWSDTEWTAEDPDNEGDFLQAFLTNSPETQQEFGIEVHDADDPGLGYMLEGLETIVSYYDPTNENGINGDTLYFFLTVSSENFQNGSYEGNIYLSVYAYYV